MLLVVVLLLLAMSIVLLLLLFSVVGVRVRALPALLLDWVVAAAVAAYIVLHVSIAVAGLFV